MTRFLAETVLCMCSTEGSLAKMQSTDRGLARKKGILTQRSLYKKNGAH